MSLFLRAHTCAIDRTCAFERMRLGAKPVGRTVNEVIFEALAPDWLAQNLTFPDLLLRSLLVDVKISIFWIAGVTTQHHWWSLLHFEAGRTRIHACVLHVCVRCACMRTKKKVSTYLEEFGVCWLKPHGHCQTVEY